MQVFAHNLEIVDSDILLLPLEVSDPDVIAELEKHPEGQPRAVPGSGTMNLQRNECSDRKLLAVKE